MTTLLVRMTQSEILLAADSKMVWESKPTSKPICKILQVGKTFLATTGLAFYKPTDFETNRIIQNSMKQENSLLENLQAFEINLKHPLETAISKMSHRHTLEYNNHKEKAGLSLIAAEVSEGVAKVAIRSYRVELQEEKFLMKLSEKIDKFDTNFAYLFGKHEAINAYIENSPEDWKEKDWITKTQDIINIGVEADLTNSGPPSTILHISENGAEWIQNECGCPEILNY